MKRITQRVVFATAVLVVAIAGAALAAGTITGQSIKDGTITGKDVRNHSLTKKDFRGSVRGPRGFRGPQGLTGAQGVQGPQGPRGQQGPAGPSALSTLHEVSATMTVAAGEVDGGTVTCPAGERAVSAGFFTDGPDAEVFLSEATLDRTGWDIALDNFDSSIPADLDGYVYCAGAGKAVAAKARRRGFHTLKGHAARQLARRIAAHR